MDQTRIVEMALRIEHQHTDGSWGEMIEDHRTQLSPVDHDPERTWGSHRIFRCTSCDDAVTIVPADDTPPSDE